MMNSPISRHSAYHLTSDPWIILFIILQCGVIAFSAFFPWFVLLAVIGVILFGYSLKFPVLGLVILILLHALILKQSKGISIQEIIYGSYFVLFYSFWLFQRIIIKGERLIHSSRELWLLSFIGLCFFSLTTALIVQGKVIQWFRELIPFLTLLLYFPLVDVMKNRRNAVILLISFFALAVIIGVQNIFGYRENLRAAVYFWEIASGRQVANEAIFFSGIVVLMGMFFHTSSYAVRIFLAGLLIFFGLTLVVTFSRGYWIGTVLGIMVIFFLLDLSKKIRFLVSFAVFIIASLSIFYMLFGSITPYLEKSILQRASTLSALQSDISLMNRLSEAKSLIGYIVRSPIIGYGLGAAFSYFNVIHFITVKTFYSHNAYLYLWFKLGIFGVISFLGFYCANLKTCWKFDKMTEHEFEQGIMMALVAILVAMIPLSITSPQFIQKDSLLVITLITSYITVMERDYLEKSLTLKSLSETP